MGVSGNSRQANVHNQSSQQKVIVFFLQIRLGQENLMIIFKMSFIEMERKLHWQLQSFRNCRFVEYVDDLLKSRQKDVYFPTCTHPYMKVRTEMCKKVLKKIHC